MELEGVTKWKEFIGRITHISGNFNKGDNVLIIDENERNLGEVFIFYLGRDKKD